MITCHDKGAIQPSFKDTSESFSPRTTGLCGFPAPRQDLPGNFGLRVIVPKVLVAGAGSELYRRRVGLLAALGLTDSSDCSSAS